MTRRGGWFRRFADAPWWVHVLVALGAVLSLLITTMVVLALVFVDIVREHGPLGPDIPAQTEVGDDDALELARRFAPILRYDSDELFVPISRSSYVSRTQLKEEEGRFVRLVKEAVDEGVLPETLGACLQGCLLFLDVRGAEPDPPKHSERAYDAIENKLLRSGARPTVYYHVTRYDDTDHYAVQYWLLYFFNYRLNEHESDWEQITVHLDENRRPIDVYYSAHEGGNTRAFAKVAEGDHPIVYPARGSHANYFGPGKHDVEIACRRVIGSIKRCLRGGELLHDITDARGVELEVGGYDLAELGGPVYVGSYGSGNYVVLTRKPSVLRDPRLRTAWLDPLRPLR
jgi:hypothetical protein